MFNVNDYIMYGTTGVCQITEIKTDKFIGDVEAEYYILHPVFANNETIMTPVNNQRILMRSLATKQEVDSIIENSATVTGTWIDDDNLRNKTFKEALRTGRCDKWINLIKEIYQKRKEKTESGKKLRQSDEDIIKSAERLLFEEFSFSLQIPIEDVESYILDRISE